MSDKSKAHAAALRQQRRRSKPGPMLWVVLALMGVAVVVMIASLSTQTGMGATPEFTATTLSGDTIQLSGYRGQVVMLNFWATWCPPCIEEMPLLDGAHAPDGDGLMVIGVALDDGAAVQQFLAKNPVSYPILLAGDTAEADLSTRFGNSKSVLPYSVLIGRDGRVLAQKFGLIRPHDLEAWQALSAP